MRCREETLRHGGPSSGCFQVSHYNVKGVKKPLRAELWGPGEGLRRQERLSEESWSVRKGFSEVGLNRAFTDGLLEKGVPPIQEDVRKGTKVDRKQQQQQWQGLILHKASLDTIRQSPGSVPVGPQALRWMRV